MEYFEFVLKNNNQKTYKLFFWFLFFLHVAAVCLTLLKSYNNSKSTDILHISILAVYIAFILLYYYFRNRKHNLSNYAFLLGIVHTVFWIKQLGYWAALIPASLVIFAEIIRKRKNSVLFSNDCIVIKSILSVKKHQWIEIDNVILKDDLLTIDFKSNKLFQAEIAEGNSGLIKRFNDFVSNEMIISE